MKTKAALAAGIAVGASVGLHLVGFAVKPNSTVQIEGGAPIRVAMLGNSFADMTEGSVESVPQDSVTEPVEQVDETQPVDQVEQTRPVDQVEQTQPVDQVEQTQPVDQVEQTQLPKEAAMTPSMTTVDVQKAAAPDPSHTTSKPELAETRHPVMVAAAIVESRTNPVVALIEEPVLIVRQPVVRPLVSASPSPASQALTKTPSPTVATAIEPPVKPVIARPVSAKPASEPVVLNALAPSPPRETVTGKIPVVVLQATAQTVRPVARPMRSAEVAIAKPARAKPTRAKPAPAPASRKGGKQTTKAGQADGTSAGRATTSSNQRSVRSGNAGNAAASNYPGLVMSRIRRVRKERAGAKGKATVGFSISASGAARSVRILGSSGSAKIDRIAVRHIQRASPFPAPPKGARRTFSVVFVSKR